jgi:hypothetical protein
MLAHSELRRELASILLTATIILFLMLLVVVPAHSQVPGTTPKPAEIVDQGDAPVAMIVILLAQFVVLVCLLTMYLSREAWLKPPRERHPHRWQHIHVHH